MILTCTIGKVIREGMGQATNRSSNETLDLVITNALIVDWSGIYKVIPSTESLTTRVNPIDTGRYWY